MVKKNKKVKIIITGALGQDGVILSMLLNQKFIVYGFIKNKKYQNKLKNVIYKKIDLLDEYKVKKLILKIKPSAIIHFASNNPSFADQESKKKFYDYNYRISKNLIDSIISADKKIKFIFANSSQIFGNKKGIVDEQSRFIKSNYYTKFRINICQYLLYQKKKFNLKFTNLILFNHDSIYRNKKFLIPRLVLAVVNNNLKFIKKIYKSNIVGDFSHAEDINKGIVLLLRNKLSPDNLILSSNKLTRINDIILYLLKKNNTKIKLIPKYFNKKNFILGNNKFAKKILKWRVNKNIYKAVDEIYNSLQL
jgi:nucleoside-diphosphate-sugar epimerase